MTVRANPHASVALAIAVALAGCKHERAAKPPEPVDECERREGFRDGEALTCANPTPDVGPTVAGPGQLRAIFGWPVPGVPRARTEDGFFVVDLTPTGQTFVASGSCPRGTPAAMSWDAHRDFHVICEAPERVGDDATRSELHDLSLAGDRFVEQRRPLVVPPGPSRPLHLIVAYPEHGEPVVFYTQLIDDAVVKLRPEGPVQVRRWADAAHAYVPSLPMDGEVITRPRAVIVQAGVVRFVASVPTPQGEQFRLVEPGPEVAIDRGALAVEPLPAEYWGGRDATTFDASVGDRARIDLVVATLSETADDGLIHLDDARAVPGPDATNAQRCPADLCERTAIAGGEQGCVCAAEHVTSHGAFALRVARSRPGR